MRAETSKYKEGGRGREGCIEGVGRDMERDMERDGVFRRYEEGFRLKRDVQALCFLV